MKYYLDDINYQVKNNAKNFIEFCENEYYNQVLTVAKSIAQNAHIAPVVLISGPSGSGKTTTAMILESLLDSFGHEAHTISLDNYFRELDDNEFKLAKDGKLDLESPERLDKNYLNMQIRCILDSVSVDIPRYNFTTCKREFSGWTLKRKEGEIIIFEGTHALNPQVITIPDEECARLYVSIRSQFVTNKCELRSKVIRLGRRILRDVETRDRDPLDTFNMYHSVNDGEDKFIKPYMARCNYSIDTIIPYEINIYRTLLLKSLKTLPQTDEVVTLTNVIKEADPLSKNMVPSNSLLREFIGDSSLKYL
ncbi:MAG: nucleoside kinase [Ruminococcaceae bacterium]|nr:nucleoside kinase [Oscillospiraceae bacterium]